MTACTAGRHDLGCLRMVGTTLLEARDEGCLCCPATSDFLARNGDIAW